MFLSLFYQILPLICLILIGYGAGRVFKLHATEFAVFVAFVLAPLVSLGAILQLKLSLTYMMLIPLGFIISTSTTLIAYYLGRIVFKNNLANAVAISSCAGNTGFFGLPVFMMIAPPSMVGVYLMLNVGLYMCESSLGYYIAAKGQFTTKQSLIKLLKTPPIHAIWIGLLLNIMGVTLSDTFITYWQKILNSWIVMGMMLIGIALASYPRLSIDIKLCAYMSFTRFIVWPTITLGCVFIDMFFFHIFSDTIRLILLVMGLLPMSVSSVAVTSMLGLYSDKIAFVLLWTTLLATLVAPLAITVFLPYLR